MLLISNLTFAQNTKIDAFFAKYRHRPNTISMALPGWLVKFGLNVSGELEDANEIRPLMRGLNNMKILVMEEKNYASPREVKNLIEHARKHEFKDLISVREEGSRVNIMLKTKHTQKGEIIKNVLILVSEEEELVLITFNGRWKKDALQKLLEEGNGGFIDSFVKLD